MELRRLGLRLQGRFSGCSFGFGVFEIRGSGCRVSGDLRYKVQGRLFRRYIRAHRAGMYDYRQSSSAQAPAEAIKQGPATVRRGHGLGFRVQFEPSMIIVRGGNGRHNALT